MKALRGETQKSTEVVAGADSLRRKLHTPATVRLACHVEHRVVAWWQNETQCEEVRHAQTCRLL